MGNLDTGRDEELLELCRKGNLEAEEIIIERYQSLVRACARPLFLAGGDSEDLIQEGMFGLISAIRHYDGAGGATFRTYAEHCIRNRLLSAVRQAGRQKHKPLNESLPIEEGIETPYPAADPEELYINREAAKDFSVRINKELSGLERKVLGYYLDGLSYREISQRLNKPVKSIDNTVQRIRKKVAQMLNSGDFSAG